MDKKMEGHGYCGDETMPPMVGPERDTQKMKAPTEPVTSAPHDEYMGKTRAWNKVRPKATGK